MIDVTAPAAPAIVGSIGGTHTTGDALAGVAISGDHAFSTWNSNCGMSGRTFPWGLSVIDITDPSAPSPVVGSGHLGLVWAFEGHLLVAGDHVFVTRSGGLSPHLIHPYVLRVNLDSCRCDGDGKSASSQREHG